MKKNILTVALLSALPLIGNCVLVGGVTADSQYVVFEDSNPARILTSAPFRQDGVLIAIDYNPVDGGVYALSQDGNTWLYNGNTGYASHMDTISLFNGVEFDLEVNPFSRRLRAFSDLGMNYRGTGPLSYADGSTPHVVAAAYVNATYSSANDVVLYAIDSITNKLVRKVGESAPLVPVGDLGINISSVAGFDIANIRGTQRALASFFVHGDAASKLYSINLTTGAATLIGAIGSQEASEGLLIRDISIVPEPATPIAIGLGLSWLALAKRRQRA